MIKKPISQYDFDDRPEVLIWYEGMSHPTVGYLDPHNKWRFMTNGHDELWFFPTFSPSCIIEPEIEPTHFWELPK